jgi:hypothetical protein
LASIGLDVEFATEILRVISNEPNLGRTMAIPSASNLRCADFSPMLPRFLRAATEPRRRHLASAAQAKLKRMHSASRPSTPEIALF